MRVLLGDRAVRRPARMPDAMARDGAVRACGLDEILEVADRADVVEAVCLEQPTTSAAAVMVGRSRTIKWVGDLQVC